jgi:ABC-type glutathione transport system ATPase component
MSDVAIRLDNLTRDFGSVRAVDHLSLEVPAGVIFGFLWPNGAGKTTTIHLLLWWRPAMSSGGRYAPTTCRSSYSWALPPACVGVRLRSRRWGRK